MGNALVVRDHRPSEDNPILVMQGKDVQHIMAYDADEDTYACVTLTDSEIIELIVTLSKSVMGKG